MNKKNIIIHPVSFKSEQALK